ncbi:MAG: glycosyltransferase involved in cell wall biosynthesis [Marivirga sp.]|jgi:glycosyltransferase involved in cell wall biosynthesis
MKKRIAIIGTVGLPANYGGFETLAEHLVDNLSDSYDMDVYCSGKTYGKEHQVSSYKGANLIYLPLKANGIQSIIYDSLSIVHALVRSDVLLILGVAGAWLLPFVKLFTNKKIIISIDGIEWKRDKWNTIAKCYLFWAESLAVRFSHIDISDNEAIQDYTAQRYQSLSRIIEYGADHVMQVKPTAEYICDYPFLKGKYAVKVCRIEPENHVHTVLAAFSTMPDRKLVVIGNWNNSDYGVQLKEKYGDCSNITILDPIYDQHSLDVIRGNAALYVHGHSAGGTNPSLVEAMFLGLPIIANGVSYNRVTTENAALYFMNSADLTNMLVSVNEEVLLQIGEKMGAIAQRRYTWGLIAQKYRLLVEEALEASGKKSVKGILASLSASQLSKMGLSHLYNQEYFYSKR